jgi:hypothetical protein
MLCDRHNPYLAELIDVAKWFAITFAIAWFALFLINTMSRWHLDPLRRIALAEVVGFIFYFVPETLTNSHAGGPFADPIRFMFTTFFGVLLFSLVNVLLLPAAYFATSVFQSTRTGRIAGPAIIFVMGTFGTYIDLLGMTNTC